MTRTIAFISLSLALLACGGASKGGSNKPLLAVGSEAPALVRVDHSGKVVSLRADTPSLVYFYPKDGTPGCTKEACAFRDSWQRYEQAGLRVIGVSTDSEQEHREFAKEHDLQFPLIADPEHAWSDAFGVPRHALAGDRDARVSFLIDKGNKVAKVYDDVDPGVHADQVLQDAKSLGMTH
ncbi:MAG TPA: peroxiredoxin [Polyangiales bacterium]|nr:peroxiredoxin [Polyangiales bacterium]